MYTQIANGSNIKSQLNNTHWVLCYWIIFFFFFQKKRVNFILTMFVLTQFCHTFAIMYSQVVDACFLLFSPTPLIKRYFDFTLCVLFDSKHVDNRVSMTICYKTECWKKNQMLQHKVAKRTLKNTSIAYYRYKIQRNGKNPMKTAEKKYCDLQSKSRNDMRGKKSLQWNCMCL